MANYNDLLAKIKTPNKEVLAQNEAVFKSFYEDMIKTHQMSVAHGGKTHIFSDYDADGICSAYILNKIFPDAIVHIGNRYDGGYSINANVEVGKFDMVISSDIGASKSDFDTIVGYNEKTGIGAFVIDHHEVESAYDCKYPRLLDFKAERLKTNNPDLPVPDYCATSLAYKLYEEHFEAQNGKLPEKEVNTVMAYACIGTIGDCVNINNELDDNRDIVKAGFDVINNVEYDSNGELNIDEVLAYLLSDRVSEVVTSKEIAFNVVPILNACSRYDTENNGGQFVYDTLTTPHTSPKAFANVDRMIEINDLRKSEVRDIYQSEGFKKAVETTDNVCIFVSDKIKKGYTGLIAGELSKQTGKPSICLTNTGQFYEGSGRNAEGYPDMLALCKTNEVLNNSNYKVGGHKMACGMKVPCDRVEYYTKQVIANYKDVSKTNVEKETFDGKITLEQYRTLEPFGTGMERPYIENTFEVMNKREMGSATNDKGQKIMAKVVQDGITYTTFSDGDKFEKGDTIKVSGELSENTYNGNTSLQVTISDIEKVMERQISR